LYRLATAGGFDTSPHLAAIPRNRIAKILRKSMQCFRAIIINNIDTAIAIFCRSLAAARQQVALSSAASVGLHQAESGTLFEEELPAP